MANYLTPPVNMVGTITLNAPFANAVVPNLPYTVAAVRTLADIAASGSDPYELYYKDAGISQDQYKLELAGGACIISLQSSSGNWVYVPNSYLATLPSAGNIPYTSYIVAVNLGPLPDSLDLTNFRSKITELAHDEMGVDNAETKIVAASTTMYLSQADSKAIETARQAVMATILTDRALYLQEQTLRLAAIQRISELETFINNNAAKLTT